MRDSNHLIVSQGEEKDRRIVVPAEGARIGRSGKNDIVLPDPLLSRHHCRVFFKGDDLWLADLGSANHTLVNGKEIEEVQLHRGDRIGLGDTVLEVTNASMSVAESEDAPVVDLGLAESDESGGKVRLSRSALWSIAAVAALLASLALLQRSCKPPDISEEIPIKPAVETDPRFELSYEKVLADTSNIFRYKMSIDADHTIHVQMDDIGNNRHFDETKELTQEQVAELARGLRALRVFDLKPEYVGHQPNTYNRIKLTVTMGKDTHESVVFNQVEPEAVREIREKIEVFGKNELGLWAQQFTSEQLLEMAYTAFQAGRKLSDERDVQYGNLSGAIRNLQEAEFHLSTIDQKPDYYGQLLALLTDCKEELARRHASANFRVDQAIRLRQWEDAARELRMICEMIPNRDDERHRQARTKLLEIETRLKTRR